MSVLASYNVRILNKGFLHVTMYMVHKSISILFVFFTCIKFSINTDPSRIRVIYKYTLAYQLEGSITTSVEVLLLFTVIWRRIFNTVQ